MLNIKVEAHADGVRRDEIIHLTRLIHVHLSVARTWAQRAHHDSRPAALAL